MTSRCLSFSLLILLLLVGGDALAAEGFNSTPGSDLPLGAGGGGPYVTIKNGSGNVGIHTNDPKATLDVNGGVRVGDDALCNAQKVGTLRFNSDKLQVCDAATLTWKNVGGQSYRAIVTFPGYESQIGCEMFTACDQTIWPGVYSWDQYMRVITYAGGGYWCTHTQIWCGGCLLSPQCYVSITRN